MLERWNLAHLMAEEIATRIVLFFCRYLKYWCWILNSTKRYHLTDLVDTFEIVEFFLLSKIIVDRVLRCNEWSSPLLSLSQSTMWASVPGTRIQHHSFCLSQVYHVWISATLSMTTYNKSALSGAPCFPPITWQDEHVWHHSSMYGCYLRCPFRSCCVTKFKAFCMHKRQIFPLWDSQWLNSVISDAYDMFHDIQDNWWQLPHVKIIFLNGWFCREGISPGCTFRALNVHTSQWLL